MTEGEKITESLAQGKSLGTSLDLGAIEGVESLFFTKAAPGYALKGLKLFPAEIGAKEISVPLRVQGAVSGAAQGMGIASVGEEARKQVLSAAGYPEEAAQHNWDNPDSLIMAGLFSGVFGGLHPKVLPSHKDALLYINDAHAIEHPDGLSATNPAANNALVDGMNQAVHDLANGEPVTSSLNISRRPDIPEELIALAGERMSRGERQPLEQQKADIEYKLKQIEEGDYTQQGLDRAAEQQTLLDADNSGRVSTTGRRVPARKLADQRKASQEAATALGEEVRTEDAQPLRDSLNRLNETLTKDDQYRAAHAEISRQEQQHLLDNGFITHPETKKMREALQEEVKRSVIQAEGESFAARTGRKYDALNYTTGTAHLFDQVLDFYDKHVAHLAAKGSDLMPDSLFRIGRIDDNTAADLAHFLPGFHNGLREARISAQSIKHIHDSRPDIAKEVLARLENGVLKADEVLPNPNSPANKDRAYLVLKDIGHESDKNKRGATVVEVSANGKGIDIVSSMTMPERSLKKARELKKKMELSRSEGQQLGSEPNSPHRHLSDKSQTHAAADSLHFERDNKTIDPTEAKVNNNEPPEITAAREALPSIPADKLFEVELEDGSIVIATADEHLAREDQDAAFAEQSELATDSAISCFLKFGDL